MRLNPLSWAKSAAGAVANTGRNAVAGVFHGTMGLTKTAARVAFIDVPGKGYRMGKGAAFAIGNSTFGQKVLKPAGIAGAVLAGVGATAALIGVMREKRRVTATPSADAGLGGVSYMNVPEASLSNGLVTDGQWAMNTRGMGRETVPNTQPGFESPDGKPIGQLGGGPRLG